MAIFRFPTGFLWGAATAAHQVEGHTHNQWSEWERSPGRFAQLEREGLIAKHGLDNFISGAAADHYNRYKEDFRLARQLGHTATRISLEWSRIEPHEGYFDEAAVTHYRDVIAAIRKNGMEPFVTLWHWTFPLWFRDKGGFLGRENVKYFAEYAERMVREFPQVTFWITLNEPIVYAGHGYLFGMWPPQKKSKISTVRVVHNLIRAHRMAYARMKRENPNARIGIAKSNAHFEAYRGLPQNVIIKKYFDWSRSFYFLNKIAQEQDFIGLNHYFRDRIHWGRSKNENLKTSDMGWELYPDAIYHVLRDLRKYRVPVYITENGLADAHDVHREWFLKESLVNVHRAITSGVDVRGYLHWALMDNFEWDKGFWPRFGLIAVDYKTQKRTPRPSAYAYKKICEANAVEL